MLTGPIGLLGLVYFPSMCPPTGPRVYILRIRAGSLVIAHVYVYTLEYAVDGTRVEQVRKDGYVLAWTHQVLFVRFSYVGDVAPSLGPSTYLRPIPLLTTLTIFFYFSQRDNRRLRRRMSS